MLDEQDPDGAFPTSSFSAPSLPPQGQVQQGQPLPPLAPNVTQQHGIANVLGIDGHLRLRRP